MYQQFIRINDDGIVIDRLSSAEDRGMPDDILYASGDDVPRQFTLPITNARGQYIYRWQDGLVERTQQELDAEWAARPAPPTAEDRLAAAEAAILALMDRG